MLKQVEEILGRKIYCEDRMGEIKTQVEALNGEFTALQNKVIAYNEMIDLFKTETEPVSVKKNIETSESESN